jgi:MoaA/NifB/PqqE/SkfB family radical SAM enzyme
MKVFHYKEKIDSLPPHTDKIMPPVHIRIKPTNVCNHNCRYCAYRADNLQLGKDMVVKDSIPKDKMMEVIEDVIEMGVKAVTFSGGGEPFCYSHLLETIKKLSQSPVKFAALTNGSRLNGELATWFARYATWLRVSMDGWDGESYAVYRGVSRNEFSKIMNNMERFAALEGNCYLGVSLIVDRSNAPHIYAMTGRLKDIGVNSVKISPCVVSNDGAENNMYHRPVFEQVKAEIKKAFEDFADDSFEIFDAYHELGEKFHKHYTWCPYLQILPVIGADLNIYPCQDKAYNLEEGVVGSIKARRFKEFWMSDKEKFFRINPSVLCGHHCVANQKNIMLHEYLNADREHLGFV